MSHIKKQAPILHRKQKDNGINKKAIIWIGSIFVALVILMTVLLILNS